jgi:hypothetical protein
MRQEMRHLFSTIFGPLDLPDASTPLTLESEGRGFHPASVVALTADQAVLVLAVPARNTGFGLGLCTTPFLPPISCPCPSRNLGAVFKYPFRQSDRERLRHRREPAKSNRRSPACLLAQLSTVHFYRHNSFKEARVSRRGAKFFHAASGCAPRKRTISSPTNGSPRRMIAP